MVHARLHPRVTLGSHRLKPRLLFRGQQGVDVGLQARSLDREFGFYLGQRLRCGANLRLTERNGLHGLPPRLLCRLQTVEQRDESAHDFAP